MISNKQELRRYLEMDAIALGVNPVKRCFRGKEIWKFQKSSRKYEHSLNCGAVRIHRLVRYAIYRYWALKLGLAIPPNVFRGDYGLIIMET